MKLSKTNIFNLIYSFIATCGFYFYIKMDMSSNIVVHSDILFCIFYFVYYYFLYKITNDKKINISFKNNILFYIFSLFFATILIIGKQLEYYSEILWTISTVLKIVFLTISLIPIFILIKTFISNYNYKILTFKNEKFLKVKIFAIISFFSLLVYLALFPGIFGYDAGYQIYEFMFKDVQITTRFSIPTSYLLYFFVSLGQKIFNSYSIGFGIYTFLQMIFLNYVCSKLLYEVYKRTKNKYITIGFIIFFSLFLPHHIMLISSTQDGIFAGVFVLCLIELVKIFFDKIRNGKIFIKLDILLFILFTLRNNAIYIIILLLPFILFLDKRNNIKLILILLIPVVLFKFYSGPILNKLNIIDENSTAEILSVPSQQIARVVIYNKNVLTEKDIQNINNFYPNFDFTNYQYRQSLADPIKGQLNNEYTKKNMKEYIKLYFKIGVKAPKEYIEAFLLNSLGLWYPNKYYNDSRMYHPYLELDMLDSKSHNERYIIINRNSKLPYIKNIIYYVMENNNWQKIPIISSLFNISTYLLVLLFSIIYLLSKKAFNNLTPLVFIMGYAITICVAPGALVRYMYPIILASPVFVIAILEPFKTHNNINKKKH